MTVSVSETPSILRTSSIHLLMSAIAGAAMIAAISYWPVISYTTLTPFRFISSLDTADVSAVEATEISVIALVLSLAPSSMVKRLMIILSRRFLTLLRTADSESPISLAISTNALRESACKIRIIFSSVSSALADISSLFLISQYNIYYINYAGNRHFIHNKWRKQSKNISSRIENQQSTANSVKEYVFDIKA